MVLVSQQTIELSSESLISKCAPAYFRFIVIYIDSVKLPFSRVFCFVRTVKEVDSSHHY